MRLPGTSHVAGHLSEWWALVRTWLGWPADQDIDE